MLLTFTRWVTFGILRFDPASRLGETVQFFLYDTVKILALLAAVIFVIGVVRTYVDTRRMKRVMAARGITGYMAASLFGAVTPFCSCSSIPIFLAFLKAGAPLGVMFAFLITSPLVNEYVVVLMAAFFGWKIAVLYTLSGIMIGVCAGMVLARMNLERFLVTDFIAPGADAPAVVTFTAFKGRLLFAWGEVTEILAKIWLWVLAGVALGAVIHNYVPQTAIEAVIHSTGVWSVPLAVLIGVPMYGSCAAIVPIAVALFQKGVPLGTALAFMMAISALSLPEAVMLRRAMTLRLIMVFFGVTTAGIILTGYLFNVLQGWFI